MALKELWWQKYRPKTLDTYIFQNEAQEKVVRKFIEEGSFPSLLFWGLRGSGKTTLAKILINSTIPEEYHGHDVLQINGSSRRGIDVMRNEVKAHISSMPMGEFKVVFVDEADGLSADAQAILRGLMEEYDHNARFIFTCNYVKKLSLELRSRFDEYKFSRLSTKDFIKYGAEILLNEGVSLDTKEERETLKSYAELFKNDLRKFVTSLQTSAMDGKLIPGRIEDDVMEYGIALLELLNKNDWIGAREMIAENLPEEDLPEVYQFLYSYLHEIEKFKDIKKWNKGIVIISDYLYRHSMHLDAEINFAGCMIKLSEV